MKIVKRIFQGFGIIIGMIVICLSIVTFVPGFEVPEQSLEREAQLTKEIDTKSSRARKDVSFKVKETSLSAWLYLPEDLQNNYLSLHGALIHSSQLDQLRMPENGNV